MKKFSALSFSYINSFGSWAKWLCSHAFCQQRLFFKCVHEFIFNYSTYISMTTTLLLVHPTHMDAKGFFSWECFLTMDAIVTKMPREVGAFNMIPHMTPPLGLLPALGTLVVPLPILKHWLLHVLVKHSSCAKMSWEIKTKFIQMLTSKCWPTEFVQSLCCSFAQ